MNNSVYKKRSLESSETPVLYRGRTAPKVNYNIKKNYNFKQVLSSYRPGDGLLKSKPAAYFILY